MRLNNEGNLSIGCKKGGVKQTRLGFYVKAAEIEGSMANGDPIDSSIDSWNDWNADG